MVVVGRYPDLQSLADAGLTSAAEIEILETCTSKNEIAFTWCGQLIRRQEETNAAYINKDQIRLLRQVWFCRMGLARAWPCACFKGAGGRGEAGKQAGWGRLL